VVTPRVGKPVEVNALWINALETIAQFCAAAGAAERRYEKLSAKAQRVFRNSGTRSAGAALM